MLDRVDDGIATANFVIIKLECENVALGVAGSHSQGILRPTGGVVTADAAEADVIGGVVGETLEGIAHQSTHAGVGIGGVDDGVRYLVVVQH